MTTLIESITRPVQSQYDKRKFRKKSFLTEIFLCLFYNFRGSKLYRLRMQNKEKQTNSLK
jgi:hypothetical protein